MTQVRKLDTPDDIPRGSTYAYHVTRARNKDAISRNGIQPSYRGPRGSKVDELLQHHRQPDDEGPSHRSECVFLYPDADRAINPVLETDEVCFVVQLDQLSNRMYTASYDAVTELYTVSLDSDAAVDAARAYWESCETYGAGRSAKGEILVEGGVPPSAILGLFEG